MNCFHRRLWKTGLNGVLVTCCLGIGGYHYHQQPNSAYKLTHVTKAAQDFLKALESSQRNKASFPFDREQCKDWSNVPYLFHPCEGVRFGEMSIKERRKAHQLFQTVLSSQGYLKVSGVMNLDDLLKEIRSRTRPDRKRVGVYCNRYDRNFWGTPPQSFVKLNYEVWCPATTPLSQVLAT
jgi:hypothetical protein